MRNETLNKSEPNKAYENKQIRVSLQVREKGVDEPSGTFGLYAHVNSSADITLKDDIPLTTDWQNVEVEGTIREIADTYPSLIFKGDAITSDMELFVKDVSIEIIGDAPTPTPAPTAAPGGNTETIAIGKSVTIAKGTAAWGGFSQAAFDTTIDIKETDTVKAKIKVHYDGETEEVTSPAMQFCLYTGDNAYNTRCYCTNGLVSGTLKELAKKEADPDNSNNKIDLTGDKTVKGFIFNNASAVDASKDLIVELVELQITHASSTNSNYVIDFNTTNPAEYTWRGYSSAGIEASDGYFWYEYGSTGHEWETGYYGYPVLKITLPSGRTLADYDSISLKYKGLAGDANYKTVKVYIVKESADATGSTTPSIVAGQASTSNAMADWVTLSGYEISADKVAADLNDLTASTFWIAIDAGCGNAEKNGAQTKFAIDDLTFHAK